MDDLHYIYKEIHSWFSDDLNYSFSTQEYNEFKILYKDTIETFYPHLIKFIQQLDSLFEIEISYRITNIKPSLYDFNQQFIKCEDRDAFYDSNYYNSEIINKENLSIEQKILYEQYNYLMNLPQPVQKSKEWFDMRNNMITASNCGSVIGECKYTPIKALLIDKIGLGEKFKENKFVYHGKKYEKIAIMIYENIYNSKVGEFGLIQHPNIPYLGASPDGISMSLTLDGKLNRLMGRMLEIKCPPARKIINLGQIKGDICPDYYWIQVQIQLECCNLPECDFWQCHLIEYESENEFLNDPVDDLVHSQNELYAQDISTEITIQPPKIYIDRRNRKGALIELLPINRSNIPKGDLVEWYGKYIYPPTILMNESEYKLWIDTTIKNLHSLYPELISEYRYNKVVYWKLQSSHNELIMRQQEWFQANKEYYRIFWNRVLYYREHIDHAKYDLIDRRLSNDLFLKTDTDRIIVKEPIIKKDSIFIKSTNKEKNTDEFLSSSDKQVKIISKKPLSKKQEYINRKVEIISSESEKPAHAPAPTPTPMPIKIPVYKNSINTNNNFDNDNLDLVMIGENRKKKNNKK
jgi:putative phage-type endonuclease